MLACCLNLGVFTQWFQANWTCLLSLLQTASLVRHNSVRANVNSLGIVCIVNTRAQSSRILANSFSTFRRRSTSTSIRSSEDLVTASSE